MSRNVFFRMMLLLASALFSSIVYSQPGGGRMGLSNSSMVRGSVVLSPDSEGGEEVPGQGVVVQVIRSLKEKKYTVVGERGSFMIWGITPGQAIVSFSMMGYETLEKVVDLVPGENKIVANLKPTSEALKGAVIKEYVNPISVVSDTVIFKASAVKVQKGEMAIDILEQMPGVEVTEDGIKVMNEQVKNVYVDGALLFGDAPMTALKNLAAEDVTTIKSYQEYANKDPHHKISKNEEKQRVLDVQTKSKPKFVKSGDLIAGGGFDTDSTYHKFRYTLGGNASFFSEKLVLMASANINNINNANNRIRGNVFQTATSGGSPDLRSLTASVSAAKKWMSPTTRNFVLGSVTGGYSLADSYNVSESITRTIYFPGEQFDSRQTERINSGTVTRKNHAFRLGGEKALKDGSVKLDMSYTIRQSLQDGWTSERNIQDGGAPEGNAGSNHNDTHGGSFSMNTHLDKGFANRWRLSFDGNFSRESSDMATVRQDTLLSTITCTVLDIEGTDGSTSWGLTPSLRYELNDNLSISAACSWDGIYSTGRHLAFDTTNPSAPVEDGVNTRTWTSDDISKKARISLDNHFDKLNANLRLSAGYREDLIGMHETYPSMLDVGGPYRYVYGNASLGNESTVNHWSLKYSTTANAPSLSQIDPNLDNDNLYSLQVGNPDLDPSRSHSFSFDYNTVVGMQRKEALEREKTLGTRGGFPRRGRMGGDNEYSTLSVNLRYNLTTDPIVVRQNYYKTETYVPEYDYTMPAQSTLTTYENAGPKRSGEATVMYGTQLRKIMCILNLSGNISWDSSPSYVNRTLTRTDNFRPSVGASIRSNFSRKVRLNFGLRGAYVRSSNDKGDLSEYFTERLTFGGEVNQILKHFYVGGNYFKLFTQGMEYGKFNDNILNLRVGGRFGPKNNFDVSLSANDIFNTTTGFSTSMNANYVRNTWDHQFGRYVMLTLAYRFNQGGAPGGRGPGGSGRGF